MLNHPYKGMFHDAKLYTLQALSHIEPEIFRNDLFLRNDSQDNYTVFSPLYAYLIKLTNVSAANIMLFIIGHILWFFSAYLVAGLLNKGPLKFIALALAVAMPSYYGAKFIFSYGEPFLTPRIFSEAFVLFSIFFALKNRFILCAILLVMGFLMHPLVALSGFIFFYFYFFIKNPKPAIIIGCALVATIMLLALCGVAPCNRIFQSMDPYWASIVNEHSPWLFLLNWNLQDFLPIVTSFLVILFYTLTHKGMKQAIALSLLTAIGVCLFLSMMLGDVFRNVLVLQLQIWRITWLLLFFSYLALPSVYIKIKEHTHLGTSFLFVCGAAWLSPGHSMLSIVYISLVAISFLLVLGNYRNDDQFGMQYGRLLKNRFSEDFWKKLNIVLVLFSIALLVIEIVIYYFVIFSKLKTDISLINVLLPLNSIYAFSLLIAVGAPLLYFQLQKKDKRVIILSMVFFLLAATLWDRRLECEKLFGGNYTIEQTSLVQKIPITSEILWIGFPEASWFLAKHTNYVSLSQRSGIVFSRDTAILFNQRIKDIGLLGDLDKSLKFYLEHKPNEMKMIYEEGIKKCCRQAKDLDYIVALYKIPEYQPLKILSLKNVRSTTYNFVNLNYKDFDWYLYDCKSINKR